MRQSLTLHRVVSIVSTHAVTTVESLHVAFVECLQNWKVVDLAGTPTADLLTLPTTAW